MQEQPIDQEAAARGKRRLITIFCVMITILLLGILLYYVNCIRPVNSFRALYADGQYEAALTLYENTLSKVDGNARKAEQCVRDHLEHAWASTRKRPLTGHRWRPPALPPKNIRHWKGILLR